MNAPALFHESLLDALAEVVRALGGSKAVGAKMRPEKGIDAAGRWLNDALNPNREEKLDPDQLLWILREGRAAGCHAAANYIMREAGYSDPTPVEPEDERARAQRDFETAVKALGTVTDRLARMGIKVAA